MFKYKKLLLNTCTILYVILFTIEVIIYLFCDNNIFGIYYLFINLLILFLLIPCAYNYKRHYSLARISKLIIIILIGIFNSYFLQMILLKSVGYVDSSNAYLSKIFIYKSILKGIIYFILTIFTLIESKIIDVSKISISNKSID